jgi:hypothetical protein
MKRVFFLISIASLSACVAERLSGNESISEIPIEKNVCESVAKIREYPLGPDWPIQDVSYNKLRADPQSAKSCLLDLITNETLMTDPRSEPTKVDGFVVGDLAFFLLSDFGLVSYDEVLPNEAKERGVLSYFAWVKQPGNRKLLQTLCADWIKKNVTN